MRRRARAEIAALREVIGVAARDVTISSTKGPRGHAMGAAVEDVAAIFALRSGRAPSVDGVPDAAFADLTFSDGAPRAFEYCIHLALGMGSHVACVVYALQEDSQNSPAHAEFPVRSAHHAE